MSYLTSNLNYQAGQLIIAKAVAHNSIGWSIESLENQIGVVAQTIPTQAPMNFTISPTSTTSVLLTWTS